MMCGGTGHRVRGLLVERTFSCREPQAHNLKVAGSNPAPATILSQYISTLEKRSARILRTLPASSQHCGSKRARNPAQSRVGIWVGRQLAADLASNFPPPQLRPNQNLNPARALPTNWQTTWPTVMCIRAAGISIAEVVRRCAVNANLTSILGSSIISVAAVVLFLG